MTEKAKSRDEAIAEFMKILNENSSSYDTIIIAKAARNLFDSSYEKGHQEGWDDACSEYEIDEETSKSAIKPIQKKEDCKYPGMYPDCGSCDYRKKCAQKAKDGGDEK